MKKYLKPLVLVTLFLAVGVGTALAENRTSQSLSKS
jgi:hypothetical protein